MSIFCSQPIFAGLTFENAKFTTCFIIRWKISSASITRMCVLTGFCADRISLFKVYQEGALCPVVELYLFFRFQINFYSDWGGSIFFCRDSRLDQLLSPAFPSGLAGASLRDISDGYQRVDRPHIKPFSYDLLPAHVMLSMRCLLQYCTRTVCRRVV